jgi:hypothetical protein
MLKRAVLALFALFVVSVVIVAAISLSPACVSEAGQQDTDAYKRSQEPNSRYQRVFTTAGCGVRTLGGAVVDHSNEISAAVTAIATIFIALYTFALSDSTRALREAAEQQKLDMLESLRIAGETAGAAKQSAEAASESVRAFVAIERGRMFVGEFKLTSKDGNDPKPIIDYTFTNVGRGSVVVIQVSVECALIGTQISRDITFDPTKAYRANNAVGPGATMGTSTKPVFLPPCPPFSTPLTAGDYANIAAKKAWILVKGFIRYRTEFDDLYRRNFAVVYGAIGYFSDVDVPGYNEEYREPKPQ